MNAIKSTNTLKAIHLPFRTGKSDLLIEPLLKEALELNFSVITISGFDYKYPLHLFGANLQKRMQNEPKIKYKTVKDHWGEREVLDYAELGIHPALRYRYAKWWPLIKKRNQESQAFDKILFGDEKEDGTWNNNKCPYHIAKAVLNNHFPSIPSSIFDRRGDRCYCLACHNKRGDQYIYKRGKPSKQYALPLEWVRFGLKTDDAKCVMNNVWSDWYVME